MPEQLIYAKMAAVMADIKGVPKAGWNEQQRFAFRSIDDTVEIVHNALVKHGVAILPNVLNVDRSSYETSKGSKMNVATVTVEYTFQASDGSFVLTSMIGEAADSGDKALSKALSMALKYVLFQTFMIPTGDPDPDGETVPEQAIDENALTGEDKSRIAALGSEAGLYRDDLRAAIERAVGRPIASTNDLTKQDLALIEDYFAKNKAS
jgi:ERF superfamily